MIRSREVVWYVSVLFVASVVAWGQTNGPAIAKAEQPSDFTIRTTSRLVLLDVSVKDASGGFVSGLSKDEFQSLRKRQAGSRSPSSPTPTFR